MEFMQPVPAVPPSPSPTKPPRLLRKLSLYSRVRLMPAPSSLPPPPWRDWVRCGWKGWARCGVSVGKCSLTYFSRSWLTSLCQSFPFRIRLKRCLFKFFLASLWHLAKSCHLPCCLLPRAVFSLLPLAPLGHRQSYDSSWQVPEIQIAHGDSNLDMDLDMAMSKESINNLFNTIV